MGMFDDIWCEMSVPEEPKPKHPSFQTKDFECSLDRYTIRTDGTLWREEFDEHKKSTPVQVPFHGMLNFYTFEGGGSRHGPPGMWFEYEAKFTDGKCVGIECLEISSRPFGKAPELIYMRPVQVGEKS